MSTDIKPEIEAPKAEPSVVENPERDRVKDPISSIEASKIWKTIKTLMILGFWVPFCALNVLALTRSMTGIIGMAEATTGEHGGEFDPAMGADIESNNGRALIVVHEGYGLDSLPIKYKNDQSYADYLRVLEATKERYYNDGDVVVLVYDQKAWFDQDHEPQDNTLHFSTMSNNGFESNMVVVDGVSYSQSYSNLFEALTAAGVHTVEMAGEFRAACVAQVAHHFEEAGFNMGWCAECSFPSVDQMKKPELYPTLPPLPTPQTMQPLRNAQFKSAMNKSQSIRNRF